MGLEYNQGEKLRHDETGVIFTVLMCNETEMTLISADREVYIVPRDNPQGFSNYIEEDDLDFSIPSFETDRVPLTENEIRLRIFEMMFDNAKPKNNLTVRAEEAVIASQRVLKEIFRDNG